MQADRNQLTVGKVRAKLEEKLGLDASELKLQKQQIGEMVDEILREEVSVLARALLHARQAFPP
jgi:hypothetical protein